MQDSGMLKLAKEEIIRQIAALPPQTEFGVFFFDKHLFGFPTTDGPAVADEETRAAATSFVESMHGGAETCSQPAFVTALEMIAVGTSPESAIVYIGDGAGYCAGTGSETTYLRETLERVRQLRTEGTVIHAIGVLDISPTRRDFLRALTEESGGSLIEVTF